MSRTQLVEFGGAAFGLLYGGIDTEGTSNEGFLLNTLTIQSTLRYLEMHSNRR